VVSLVGRNGMGLPLSSRSRQDCRSYSNEEDLMRIQPDGVNLLDTVAAVLRDQILPGAPADQQYALRMSINAIGIARRQLLQGEPSPQAEAAELAALLGSDGDLASLNRQLAARIRRRELGAAQLSPVLWQLTLRRAAESAPRALEG
jgi:hypothetical protein